MSVLKIEVRNCYIIVDDVAIWTWNIEELAQNVIQLKKPAQLIGSKINEQETTWNDLTEILKGTTLEHKTIEEVMKLQISAYKHC